MFLRESQQLWKTQMGRFFCQKVILLPISILDGRAKVASVLMEKKHEPPLPGVWEAEPSVW